MRRGLMQPLFAQFTDTYRNRAVRIVCERDTAPHLRIGELAARSGRSTHAIPWYDAQGLIPGVVRDASGHRLFSARHVEWLALLDRLRFNGMSIAQMRSYTRLIQQGTSQVPRQRDLLATHRQQVAATLAAWRESLDLIDGKIAFYDQWIATGARPPSEQKLSRRVPARRAAAPRLPSRP